MYTIRTCSSYSKSYYGNKIYRTHHRKYFSRRAHTHTYKNLTFILFAFIPCSVNSPCLVTYVDPHTYEAHIYEEPNQALRDFTKEIDANYITIEAIISGGMYSVLCAIHRLFMALVFSPHYFASTPFSFVAHFSSHSPTMPTCGHVYFWKSALFALALLCKHRRVWRRLPWKAKNAPQARGDCGHQNAETWCSWKSSARFFHRGCNCGAVRSFECDIYAGRSHVTKQPSHDFWVHGKRFTS